MNKHLVDFMDDELQNNDYYETIREFAKGKDWNRDILSSIVNEYDDNGDAFNPYKFMDAIEDFLFKMKKSKDKLFKTSEDLSEIIDLAWEVDWFENY